jgi:hypothetical protein
MPVKILQLHSSFLDSAKALPQEVANRIWRSLYTFSRDPRHPGLHFEKLKGAADDLHSLRVGENYRIIVQQAGPVPTLLYVGPHDKAYAYAERTTASSAPLVAEEKPHPYVQAEGQVYQLEEKSVELLLGTVKYLPLAKYLLTCPKNQRTVELKFREIEQIIGSPLPPAARRHAAWWANEEGETRHVQANAWMAIGWRVHADRSISKATFERVE